MLRDKRRLAPSEERRIGRFLWGFEEEFAWLTGRRLLGLNFVQKDTHVLLIVKAEGKGGREVAFVEGSDVYEALAQMWRYLNWKTGLRWKKDKYG